MEQFRSLALLLAVHLGLLSGEQATICQHAPFAAKPKAIDHMLSRTKTLPAAAKLLQGLLNVCKGRSTSKQGAKAFSENLRVVVEVGEKICTYPT